MLLPSIFGTLALKLKKAGTGEGRGDEDEKTRHADQDRGRSKWEKAQTKRDLPKHWKDAQNHFLHGNKSLHPVNPVAGESQHGESERKEKNRERERENE